MDFVPLEQHHTALSHCFEFHIVTEQSYHCTTHMHTLCPVPYTQFGSFHPQGLVQIKYSELTNVNCIISSIFSLPFHALKWHFRFFCPLNFSLWLRFSFALMLVLAWSWLMLHCIRVFGFSLLVSGYIVHCTIALTITWLDICMVVSFLYLTQSMLSISNFLFYFRWFRLHFINASVHFIIVTRLLCLAFLLPKDTIPLKTKTMKKKR